MVTGSGAGADVTTAGVVEGEGVETVAGVPAEQAVKMSAASRAPDAVSVFFMEFSLGV